MAALSPPHRGSFRPIHWIINIKHIRAVRVATWVREPGVILRTREEKQWPCAHIRWCQTFQRWAGTQSGACHTGKANSAQKTDGQKVHKEGRRRPGRQMVDVPIKLQTGIPLRVQCR